MLLREIAIHELNVGFMSKDTMETLNRTNFAIMKPKTK